MTLGTTHSTTTKEKMRKTNEKKSRNFTLILNLKGYVKEI